MRVGGSELVSIQLAKILKKNGRDVRFVCLGGGDGDMRERITPQFELECLNCKRTLTALPALTRLMRDRRDACLFSSLEYVSLLALMTGKKFGLPVIVRLPNMPGNVLYSGFTEVKWKVIRWLNRKLLRRARTIIAQTDAMRQQALECYPLREDQVVTLNNPLDQEHVLASAENGDNPFEKGKTHFLTVCNIAYSKGVDILTKAFIQVKKAIPNAVLTIVGRDTTDYGRRLRASLQENADIRFLGFKHNPYPYMRYCDVFVLPSRMEGFPNVLLEAMCFNHPVVSTTCVPVVKKLIRTGENGYFCDIDNSQQLARCMTDAVKLHNIHNHYDLFDEELLLSIFP